MSKATQNNGSAFCQFCLEERDPWRAAPVPRTLRYRAQLNQM